MNRIQIQARHRTILAVGLTCIMTVPGWSSEPGSTSSRSTSNYDNYSATSKVTRPAARLSSTDRPTSPPSTLAAEASDATPKPKAEPASSLKGQASLQDLIRDTLQRNPRIAAARHAWKASLTRPRQMGALPDPVLTYTRFLQTPETRVGPQKDSIMFGRKIPGGSKRRLRSEVAFHAASASEQQYRAVSREIALRVREHYYDYYFARKAIGITHESIELMVGMEKIAQVRYSTGNAPQEDVLKAQVEISKLRERLIAFSRQEEILRARMNSLRDRPSSTALSKARVPKRFAGFQTPLSELEIQGQTNRQEVLAAREIVRRDLSALALAKEAWSPDYTVGLGYVGVGEGTSRFADDGKDVVAVTASVNLPFFNERRIEAEIDDARETLEGSRARQRDVENSTTFDVAQAYFVIDAAQRTVRLYQASLLPEGQQTLEAASAGYPTGLVSFLDYLDAWRILLNLRLGHHGALADYYKGLAQLERALGTDLD